MIADEEQIFEALAFLAATFPGRLEPETRRAWAVILSREGFERSDLAEACRAMVLEQAELTAEANRYWKLDLGPFIAQARRARGARIEQGHRKEERMALPQPGRTHRDPLRVKATRLTIAWVARCVSEKRTPDEAAILARTNAAHSVLLQAQQLGCSIEDDGVEAALAAEVLGRALRRLVGLGGTKEKRWAESKTESLVR